MVFIFSLYNDRSGRPEPYVKDFEALAFDLLGFIRIYRKFSIEELEVKIIA